VAARAIWKAIMRLGEQRVPVKLYSGIEDQTVHFRLLHEPDSAPLEQRMVAVETGESVEYGNTERGAVTAEGQIVILRKEELKAIEPPPSRDIDVLGFLPRGAIDHRWYDRAYFLGPDGKTQEYYALCAALAEIEGEGLARWVMRKKEYRGALRLREGYPVLITLRPADEMVPAGELQPPGGENLSDKELGMAQQLLSMLEASFDPSEYRDEYRERVAELIEAKAQGKRIKRAPVARRQRPRDLAAALRASIEKERKRA
jgi:DNA end-binding protein Ku